MYGFWIVFLVIKRFHLGVAIPLVRPDCRSAMTLSLDGSFFFEKLRRNQQSDGSTATGRPLAKHLIAIHGFMGNCDNHGLGDYEGLLGFFYQFGSSSSVIFCSSWLTNKLCCSLKRLCLSSFTCADLATGDAPR